MQLTDTAAGLSGLQAEVLPLAELISSVDAIRQQIADGSYQVDADRIADALITIEQELL